MTTLHPLYISLFETLQQGLGRDVPTFTASKVTLVDVSHTLEDGIIENRLPSVIFTGFQESSHWREETQRYLELAGIASQICIFAGGHPPVPEERHIAVTLTGDDPLRQEWFLLVLTQHFTAVLCGQDNLAPVQHEADRTFTTLFSFDPAVAIAACTAILPVVQRYRPERASELQDALAAFPPRHPDGTYTTKIMTKIIAHLQHRYDDQAEQVRELERLRMEQIGLRDMVSELAVPVVPLFEGVIVVPLVGSLDTERAQQVLENVLEGVGRYQADVVILDITGVATVDTNVANHLIQTFRATKLLGAQMILTGISAQTAQSIVHLGLTFSDIRTSSNLQTGIQIALGLRGQQIVTVR
jgi:anti-anti-sigma regulatory factor/DICT domain-containing protein